MSKTAEDDLIDILVDDPIPPLEEVPEPELPKKADGTPDIDPKIKPDPAEEARKKAEADLGKVWQEERAELLRVAETDKAAALAKAEADAATKVLAERQAREAAEGDRDKQTDIAMRAHWTTLQTRKEQFESGFTSSQDQVAALKREIKAASEAGDHDRLAELHEHMAEAVNTRQVYAQAKTRLDEEIENVRGAFSARKTEPPKEEPKEPEKKADTPKPITPDQWIDNAKTFVGDDGATWLRAHKDFVTDTGPGSKNERLIKFADYYASKYGQQALRSADFTKALDAEFFPKKQEAAVADDEVTEEVETEEVETPKRKAHAAPVSRNAKPTQGSGTSNRIQLTQDQFNIAPNLYPSYDDLSAPARAKFPAWSETAARWQYHEDLKRARSEGKFEKA